MSDSTLQQLAELCGIQTAYHDGLGQERAASAEALSAVLAALGLDVGDDISNALTLEAVRSGRSHITSAECHIAWDGIAPPLPIIADGDGRYDLTLLLESGERREQRGSLSDLVQVGPHARMIQLSESVPLGYHKLVVQAAGSIVEMALIGAPTRAFEPAYLGKQSGRPWGVFSPTYGLHRQDDIGMGDLRHLRELSDWVGELGGDLVGTLPLLAAFLDAPYEYSPYSPVSRMFWNELYIDFTAIPEMQYCPDAIAALSTAGFCDELSALKTMPLLDYRRQMKLKRGVLEILADHAWTNEQSRSRIDAFRERRHNADDYATFRALVEENGVNPAADAAHDERTVHYHLYVQTLMDEQLAAFSDGSRAGLYLDLPVGVNRDGYDVWRHGDQFASGVSVGAPPDMLFTAGQDWGLPPLLPHALRASGYRYFADCVRAHMEHADVLRVDHVMGMHRLFWIPQGGSATDGVYVNYDCDHLYAVLCLESQRNKCAVVGEDLGTVPDHVRPMMADRGVRRLHVDQFVFPGQHGHGIGDSPDNAVACINTHDMPTFAGYLAGAEIDVRATMGLLTSDQVEWEHGVRRGVGEHLSQWLGEQGWIEPEGDLFEGVLAHLLAGPAELVLINIEDLWGETEPQNVPGTGADWPNWRRRLARTMEQLRDGGCGQLIQVALAGKPRSS